jgi:hypothetical protein
MNSTKHLILAGVVFMTTAGAAELKDLAKAKAAYEKAGNHSEAARSSYIVKLVKLAESFDDDGQSDGVRAVQAEMLLHPAPAEGQSAISKALIAGPWQFPRWDTFFRENGTFATHAGSPGRWQVAGNQFLQTGGLDDPEDRGRARSENLKGTIILLNANYFVLANSQWLKIGKRLREPKELAAIQASLAKAGEVRESTRARYAEALRRLMENDEDDAWQCKANLICLHLGKNADPRELAARLPGTWVSQGRMRIYQGDGTCRDEATGEHGTWRIERNHLIREMRDEEGMIHATSARVILLTANDLISTDEKDVFFDHRKSR